MWLQDFLAKDFPDCRTVTYGYNSKLDDKTGTHMTMDYARHFLTELEKIRARNVGNIHFLGSQRALSNI